MKPPIQNGREIERHPKGTIFKGVVFIRKNPDEREVVGTPVYAVIFAEPKEGKNFAVVRTLQQARELLGVDPQKRGKKS
jgi:hypothetical protein